MNALIAIVAAYLIGSIPFGYLLAKFTTGEDVRTKGSGNIGATNVLRTAGRGAGIATLVLDIAKGVVAVWLAGWLTNENPGWMADAALAAMAGHSFPIFLKFKGGKAVATFIGAFGYLMPLPMLAVLVIFLVTMVATRYVSAASVMAAAAFPFGVWLILHPTLTEILVSVIAAGFIIYRHKPNMDRIRAGTEPVFRWGIS
jgi:glycerol-3-phosphate acyltransferase PlsY